MFTVKKKPLTPNIIWDGIAGKPLCDFGHKGVLETNDRELAEKLAAMGHTVTGEPDGESGAPTQQIQSDDAGEITQGSTDAMDNADTGADQPPEQAAEPTAKKKSGK